MSSLSPSLELFLHEQEKLSERIILEDCVNTVNLVAGVDVSYSGDGKHACAVIVVLDAETREVCELVHSIGIPDFPYVPQFLAYREMPLVSEAYGKLSRQPDLFFYDGNGTLHARKCGAASHFGVVFDVPVIGCAKNASTPTTKFSGNRGDHSPILEHGVVLGEQLITQNEVKPLYISVGHKVSLKRSLQETLNFAPDYRLPEPIRQADHLSRSILKSIY
ncbi:endonuclease V [Pseudovibrio sp. WM33]|uniref:endonuclease V n=1 Tax=Pseudovibrio sp. WM33 TaxID=1735585 RepID=UPI0007AE8B19|nr:endonuclease V [Pseudovibrio sp. WM33]KZL26482.1 Endonuclease V [Pseudovibrio sp. WM33]